MPKFIAVHTMPQSEEQFRVMIPDMVKMIPAGSGFTYKQTYCDFANHKFFCDWEAPSQDALAETFKKIGMPFDSIHPVKIFNVAAGNLE